jgi:hypothetical protein
MINVNKYNKEVIITLITKNRKRIIFEEDIIKIIINLLLNNKVGSKKK